MLIQGLDSVMFFTRDTAASVAWYRDVLGLQLLHQHGDFAVLAAGDARVSLHGGAPPEGHGAAGVTPVFRVADYAQAKAELEARGCVFTFENSAGNATFGSFSDPDGNPIQILSRA